MTFREILEEIQTGATPAGQRAREALLGSYRREVAGDEAAMRRLAAEGRADPQLEGPGQGHLEPAATEIRIRTAG